MNFERTYMETANEKEIFFINLEILSQYYIKVCNECYKSISRKIIKKIPKKKDITCICKNNNIQRNVICDIFVKMIPFNSVQLHLSYAINNII